MTGLTYYEQPLLKKPVWVWSVPSYFYVGAAAGASLALGAVVQAVDGSSSDLVRRCRIIGAAGTTLGSGLLIYDLGRPERFINMLRVFRPTSPMNVGSWLLAVTGSLAGLAFMRRDRLGDAAGVAAGLFGVPLSGYTGVLLATTAVPIWQQAARSLPTLFIASGMASAGALFHLMELGPRDEAIARRFAIAGQAAELAAMVAVKREVSRVEQVSKPVKHGLSGLLWNAAGALGIASLALSIFGGKSRRTKTAAGVCGTAAALSLRFALLEAGRCSACDPRASFEAQAIESETQRAAADLAA